MRKTVFTNNIFYHILSGYIIVLIIYNLYALLVSYNVYSLIPIAIQVFLLYMMFTKHEYARIAILIWSTVVLLLATLFEIIAQVLDGLNDGFEKINLYSFIGNLILLIVAILIVDFTRRTVVVRTLGSTVDIETFADSQ